MGMAHLKINGYKITFLQWKKNVTSLVPWNLGSNHATGCASLSIVEVQIILEESCDSQTTYAGWLDDTQR
jgi:hypothetical protein